MTDDPDAKVFDMPHARVTLTPVGPNVEIEVWPKAGQSAYAVVDPTVAVLIARHLVELAAVQMAAAQLAAAERAGSVAEPDDEDGAADGDGTDADVPDNVVSLASRRRSGGDAAG